MAHGHSDQAHEKPPEGEQREADEGITPTWLLFELMEENADSNTSVSLFPH